MGKFKIGPYKKLEDVKFDAEEIVCEDGTIKVSAFVKWHGKEYSATTTCNKNDTYDFGTGCEIAFCKLAKKIVAHEVKYAQKNQLDIPGDLSIIGYNNSMLVNCCDPELTSIDNKLETLCLYRLPMVSISITRMTKVSRHSAK